MKVTVLCAPSINPSNNLFWSNSIIAVPVFSLSVPSSNKIPLTVIFFVAPPKSNKIVDAGGDAGIGIESGCAVISSTILETSPLPKVNVSLEGMDHDQSPSTFIGVLDIFGFENFDKNSFEQLCINFANERLQKLFNDFVFKIETELYAKEGITCDESDFPDNQEIIDLISGRSSSLFGMLDEECRIPNGSDLNLTAKYHKIFVAHARFKSSSRGEKNCEYSE